jgi:hypothetical protein
MKYCGIADAHGIESFRLKGLKGTGALQLRAALNRQRHACYYEADLDDNEFAMVMAQIKRKKYDKALNVLKENAKDISLLPEQAKSWDLIPNSKLDPYS